MAVNYGDKSAARLKALAVVDTLDVSVRPLKEKDMPLSRSKRRDSMGSTRKRDKLEKGLIFERDDFITFGDDTQNALQTMVVLCKVLEEPAEEALST